MKTSRLTLNFLNCAGFEVSIVVKIHEVLWADLLPHFDHPTDYPIQGHPAHFL